MLSRFPSDCKALATPSAVPYAAVARDPVLQIVTRRTALLRCWGRLARMSFAPLRPMALLSDTSRSSMNSACAMTVLMISSFLSPAALIMSVSSSMALNKLTAVGRDVLRYSILSKMKAWISSVEETLSRAAIVLGFVAKSTDKPRQATIAMSGAPLICMVRMTVQAASTSGMVTYFFS